MKGKKISVLYFVLLGIVVGVAISIPLANRFGLWVLAWVAVPVSFMGALLLLMWGKGD